MAHSERLVVVLAWLALTIGGVAAASSLGSALSQRFSIPGGAVRTSARIAHEFGSGGQVAPVVGVVSATGRDLTSPRYAREAQAAFARLARSQPGSRLGSYATTGDPAFLSADRHTEYALVFPRPDRGGQLSAGAIDAARRAVAGTVVAGAPMHVTGLDVLRAAGTSGKGNGVRFEALLGAAAHWLCWRSCSRRSSRSCR